MHRMTYLIWIGSFFAGIAMLTLDAPLKYFGLPVIVAGALVGYKIARMKGQEKA